ncbi:MAG TPA: 2-dehydro-3-deoxyphosphogluconate aldolase [Clostridiales bacterium]|nr:2-dehydro-3-deoxyphosphogluconate aldolase [Clostridiales bacterium]
MASVMKQIEMCGIVPVIVINDAAQAVPLAKALLAGGIRVIEITFRTAAAREALARIKNGVPDMLAGAGTILSPEQLDAALDAGASFAVSPGLDADLVRAAQERQCPILPGAVTPSEIMQGLLLGLDTFKFFPAENYGGLATIQALCGPFPGIRFVPTGGISAKNAADYLKSPKILAIGGSWMAPKELIEAGDFAEILRRTEQAVAMLRSIRP